MNSFEEYCEQSEEIIPEVKISEDQKEVKQDEPLRRLALAAFKNEMLDTCIDKFQSEMMRDVNLTPRKESAEVPDIE